MFNISKEKYKDTVRNFMETIAKLDGAEVFTEGDDTIVFRNLGCDFNDIVTEYDKLWMAYDKLLNGVYDNFGEVIDRDMNIDKEVLGLVYMLAISRSYMLSDEDNELVIHFIDTSYAQYAIELYYLEWANVNIELSKEKYTEAHRRILNKFLGVNK